MREPRVKILTDIKGPFVTDLGLDMALGLLAGVSLMRFLKAERTLTGEMSEPGQPSLIERDEGIPGYRLKTSENLITTPNRNHKN